MNSNKTLPKTLLKIVREWTGIVFGLVGVILALMSYIRANDAEIRALASERAAQQVQIEQWLGEAWDLLGGRPGTTVIYEFSDDAGDMEIARRKIKSVLTSDPKNAKAIRYLAVYHEAIQDRKKALQLYERSLELDPKSSSSYLNYGVALTDSGSFEKAFKSFQTAEKLGANSAITMVNTGVLLLKQGRKKEAEKVFEEVKKKLEVDRPELGMAKAESYELLKSLQRRDYSSMRLRRPRSKPRIRRP